MPIKYSFDLLTNFCNEKNVNLLKDYSKEELFGSSKIIFNCTSCNKENVKCFTYLIKRNTLCKRCVTIESLPKQKITMMAKYGVEHASQNKEIRLKIKQGFIEKYGVDNPSKTQNVKDKMKQTNLERYGVEYIVHNDESNKKMKQTNLERYGAECSLANSDIREKIKKTNLITYGFDNPMKNEEIQKQLKSTMIKRYGVEYPLQDNNIQEKMKQTNLEKYGTECSLGNKEVRKKVKSTMIKRYGVEYATQNPEISEKASNNSYLIKDFIFTSGKIIKCQGYEPFALNDLIKNNIEENDIITGAKNVPTIWYNDENGKKHRHYVDIFIPSQNKCIEVKSTWSIKHVHSNIFFKQKAAQELGYNYEIWVYDKKGNKIVHH
jgi:hypothetical protein